MEEMLHVPRGEFVEVKLLNAQGICSLRPADICVCDG